jgi:flagellar basal-body rod protein FlgF
MDRLAYTSLSALRGAMARQTATANNLANVNTVGFRGEMAAARALWVRGDTHEARAFSSSEVSGADMRPGTINQTGRELDVAIDGSAFFTVQASDGEEAYTRRGDLQLSDSGVLTTGDGSVVLGEQGPITLPPADKVEIKRDGSIYIVPTGGDPKQPQLVDKLKIASPVGSNVVKGMDGLFRVRGGGALPSDTNPRVIAGSLEGSNVEATKALVDMMDASRAWETQLKLISTARELDGSGADLMRLPE